MMEDILNKISEVHQLLKEKAIEALQNDQVIEQHVIDGIKTVYNFIQMWKQATGQ